MAANIALRMGFAFAEQQRLQQFGDGGAIGDEHVGGNGGEGFEDKASLVYARVGDGETGFVDDLVGVEEDVEVEGSGAPAGLAGTIAVAVALDLVERVEEGAGGESCAGEDTGVEVLIAEFACGLACMTYRLRADHGALCHNLSARQARDRGQRVRDVLLPVSQV